MDVVDPTAGAGRPATLVERAFELAACGIFVTRQDGTVLRANAAALELAGTAWSSAGGPKRLDDVFPAPERSPGLAATLARAAALGIGMVEVPTVTPGGETRFLSWMARSAAGVMVLSVSDVTPRRVLGDQLAHLAYHDGLTGLPNRTLLMQRLAHALRRRQRTGTEVALIFLDLDHFKEINDVLGHEAGDQLLVSLAARLEAVIRPTDTVGRLSGDEFVVVCEDVADPATAEQVIDRMDAAVREPFVLGDIRARITASIGLSVTTGSDCDAEALLRDADHRMYDAKQRRDPARARPRSLPSEVPAGSGALDAADLRRGLDDGEIAVVYQPQVALDHRRVVSVECLVRWRHCDHGLLLPEVFLPMAEASGVITELGRHVLNVACRQAAAWAEDAERAGRPAPVVAVNISRTELADDGLPGRVSLALEGAGLDPARLRLEVAKPTLPGRPSPVGRPLARLQRLGVGLSIEGLDMVSSGTDTLGELPIEELKLGSGAVRYFGGRGWRPVAGVEELTSAALDRGLRVVAEGVETDGHAAVVDDLGAEVAQGHWFSPPQSAASVGRLLEADLRFRRYTRSPLLR